MARKVLAVPLLVIGMAFFVQCSDEISSPETDYGFLKAGKGGGGGGGGGGHTEPVGNNLSFPVFAMDGYAINAVPNPTFLTPYAGPYTGLSPEELAILEGYDWYAQKVEGNTWQAGYSNSHEPLDITFIDWGDVIEASNPVVGRPFRLETTLFVDISENTMDGYTMALLANPSSPNETQGTNGVVYEGIWATVVSTSPTLIIQFLGNGAEPVWDPDQEQWIGEGVNAPLSNFSFAPELNVGGKYIYGASMGGWRPTNAGKYRLTFFMREMTNISFENAVIGNYPGNDTSIPGVPEAKASTPMVDAVNNLSYVDVTVVTKRR